MKRKALGRGLSALLSETPSMNEEIANIQEIPIEAIEASQFQPRRHFDEDALLELADSIQNQGILQPLLVRPHPTAPEKYQLLAGERRLRAASLVSMSSVPCVVMQAEDTKALEIALVENIQRSDLSPLEEAQAYRYLVERFSLTQEDVAARVGKSREAVANTLRLLNLPERPLQALEEGKISVGHAKLLLGLSTEHEIEAVLEQIVENGLTVRETEALMRQGRVPEKPEKPKKTDPILDLHIQALRRELESVLQTKVEIKMRGKNKGMIQVHFFDLDQLDSLLAYWKVRL
ncbi:MAG: ParB/RepB/Spo0J family partition protein [bacterium]